MPSISGETSTDVRLEKVIKIFGNTTAVDNVSFEIERGDFFSILGPSGCGKTTTLRMIAGFTDPDAGEVWIEKKMVNGIPASKRHTNMVFQQLALFPHMNVFDNIAFGLRIKKFNHNEIKNRVKNILSLIRLDGFENRRIQQLSGGQQQRVAIARALINQPRVLLLDEPLGALDLQLRLQMQKELKRVQKEIGTTFVYVTHDQGEALTMSDYIAVMNQGKVIQLGSPEQIYEKPNSSFVAKFIGNTNLINGKIYSIEDDRKAIVQAGDIKIVGTLIGDQADEVLMSIRPERIVIGSLANQLVNHYRGTIQQAVFKGTTFEYRIRINQALDVDAVIPNLEGTQQYPSGSEIEIGWSIESARILCQ